MYLHQFLYLDPKNSTTPENGEDLSNKENNIDNKNKNTQNIVDESKEQTGNLGREVQLDALKKWVEINTTYDIIQGTEMYKKLKTVIKDEAEIVKFSNSIHDVVHKYILGYLPNLEKDVLEQINVWLQFSLMETLMDQGEEESLNFFEWLKKSEKKNTGKSLFNLITLFKNWWGFYSLLKKSQTFIDYINFHNWEIGKWENIQELVNAKKFKDLLANNIWEEPFESIKNNWLEDMGLSKNKTEEKLPIGITEEEKKQLQEIINNPDFPINKKIVDTITSSVETASNLLDKRHWLRVDATWLFNSLYGISSQLWMFGIKWPVDMLWLDENWNESFLIKALNFVLSLIWFSWGIMWLHKAFIKENIDKWLLKDKTKETTIIDIMKLYQQTQPEWETYIKMEDKFPEIKNLTDDQKTKLPTNYNQIQDSLEKGLTEENLKSLDPDIIRKLGSPRSQKMKTKIEKDPKTKEKTEKITEFILLPTEKKALIEKYLKLQIPELIETEGFINKIKGPDIFMLALTGNLMISQFFVEWMKIGTVNENLFMEERKQIENDEIIPETDIIDLLNISWLWDLSENKKLINEYPREASFKNNNPTWITRNNNFEKGESWLAKILKNNSINYKKWTERPTNEWSNYVKFKTIEDGLKAYKLSLKKAWKDDIYERLKSRKGTWDTEWYADKILKKSGINKWVKFSKLTEDKLNMLMNVHLKQESGWLYAYLKKQEIENSNKDEDKNKNKEEDNQYNNESITV